MCAGRCKVNVMFAGVEHSMPAQTNTATQPRCEIRGRAERRIVSTAKASAAPQLIWQELSVFPKKKDSDPWRPGSPAIEAAALFRLVGSNGDSIDDLRRLIAVSPAEEVELRQWCESEPELRDRIEGMIYFREAVLAAFDALVENAHRGDSSQGENA